MKKQDYTYKIIIVSAIMLLGFSWLTFHIYGVQIGRHTELTAKAEKLYSKVVEEIARRGTIYDNSGNILAADIPCYNIRMNLRGLSDNSIKERINFISLVLGVPSQDFSNKIYDQSGKRLSHAIVKSDGKTENVKIEDISIGRSVEFDKSIYLMKNKKLSKKERLALKRNPTREKTKSGYHCLYFEPVNKRIYPNNKLCANILGGVGPVVYSLPVDNKKIKKEFNIGIFGLEHEFNDHLQPSYGFSKSLKNARGKIISDDIQNGQQAQAGNDITLTIKKQIQEITEEELIKLVKKFSPKAAYAIMADPKTGAILSLAQYPTFNCNDRTDMTREKLEACGRNRVIEDVFEPGSIMKPIAIAGAIDAGILTMESEIDCENGAWRFCGRILHDCHPYDILNISEIIKVSSNIGTAKIAAEHMGEMLLYGTLRRFGFGQKSDLNIGVESRGIFLRPSKWDGLKISRIPIGHGISVTPIQMVQAYCALANQGKMMKLRLIEKIISNDGISIANYPSEFKRQCIKPSTAQKIVAALKKVTQQGGTAKRAAIDGYSVAGKTGTAEKVIDGRYSKQHYFTSFIGFVPADNPRFVLLVVADDPDLKKGRYGGTVAAPTFKRIAERVLKFYQVPPTILAVEDVAYLPGE